MSETGKATDAANDVRASASKPKRSFGGLVTLPLLLFAALAMLFALSLSGDPSKVPSALIGKPAPDQKLAPLAGLTKAGRAVPGFSRADLTAGKVTVVNFFASWCGPCVEEHPHLVALVERTGVPLFGANYKDPNNGGLRFLKRHGNPYTAVGIDPKGRAAIDWGVYGMPETFIVDGKGTIIFKWVGPVTEDVLNEKFIPAIERARAAL